MSSPTPPLPAILSKPSANTPQAPAYLFIGCHHPTKDALFASELKKWEAEGVVKLFYAYSQAPSLSKNCRHVQERLWEEREDMTKVFGQGAKLYVCGSARVGEGVASVTKRIYEDAAEALGRPKTEEEVEAWFEGIRDERFASDVFA